MLTLFFRPWHMVATPRIKTISNKVLIFEVSWRTLNGKLSKEQCLEERCVCLLIETISMSRQNIRCLKVHFIFSWKSKQFLKLRKVQALVAKTTVLSLKKEAWKRFSMFRVIAIAWARTFPKWKFPLPLWIMHFLSVVFT